MTRTYHHIFCDVCFHVYCISCISCSVFSCFRWVGFCVQWWNHLGKGSSHNFRGTLQVVLSKSLRTWVSFGCPLHVVLRVVTMVFPDHLFHLVGGQGRKTSRWTLGVLGVGVVQKKRRRRSRSLPCPLDHFRYGIFASAAYALGGRSNHQKDGMG